MSAVVSAGISDASVCASDASVVVCHVVVLVSVDMVDMVDGLWVVHNVGGVLVVVVGDWNMDGVVVVDGLVVGVA